MVNEIRQREAGDIVHARISKRMTLEDQQVLEAFARKLVDEQRLEQERLDEFQKLRVLIILENFEGWEKNDAWGNDLDFQFDYGDGIARIAIVGEEQWKEAALLFVGKGFRGTEIEFFSTNTLQAAEAWIRR